jgi:hypothetical protein
MHSFSPKARSFITRPPEKDKRYNILCGSVRSGKTWTMMAKLFLLCRYNVGGLRVIIGQSKQTMLDNVLRECLTSRFTGSRPERDQAVPTSRSSARLASGWALRLHPGLQH